VRAGKETHFTIHGVDKNGKPRKNGGDPFVVKINGPKAITPNVKDNGDGTYAVTYTPDKKAPGNYKVDVTLHDKAIKDSPFHVEVKPSTDASKTYATGPGLTGGFDNEPARFKIHSVDPDGKPRTEGGEPFQVKISGPVPVTPKVVDNNDGTYDVTYEADKPGNYKIDVDLEGQPIKDSPFRPVIKSGTDASLSGISHFTFTVQTVDKHGTKKTEGGDEFTVKIDGPAQVQAKTNDNRDGSYAASYTLPQPGNYSIHTRLNGKDIKGSPFKQQV